MRKLLILITQSKLWKWFILKALPYIRFTTQVNEITGKQYNDLSDHLFTGAIVLSNDKEKLSSFLIPGITSHAELCVDGTEEKMVGMTSKGFTESFLFDTCKDSDRVIILKCIDWDNDFIKEVVSYAYSFRLRKYDVTFTLGVESLYCSELIYQSDRYAYFYSAARIHNEQTKIKVDLSDVLGLGRPYLSPDGLLFAKNVVCVWDSNGELTGLTGREIELLVEKK